MNGLTMIRGRCIIRVSLGEDEMMYYNEPWKRGDREKHTVTDATGNIVIHRTVLSGRQFSDDDLNRIVACVNACRYWSTEKLRGIVFSQALPVDEINTVVVMRPAPETRETP